MDSSRPFAAKLADARRLSLREIGWFVSAWFRLPFVRWRLARRGFRRTVTDFDVRSFVPQPGHAEVVRPLARMVQAAANRHVFELPCLPRSVWIWSRLRRLGVACELKLGMNQLGPHAWVEVKGERLNEPDHKESRAVAFEAVESTAPKGGT